MTIKRTFRYFDLTMIVVSMVIGAGIFRNSSIAAQSAGSVNIFFLAWIIGGIISIIGALTFAEIGSRLPVVGGFYKTFVFCYPRPVAFALIWAYIMLHGGAIAAMVYAGAQFITPVLLPSSMNNESGRSLMFFIIIGILFILNYVGIKSGTRTQNILTGLKIIMILVLSSAVIFVKPEGAVTSEITNVTGKNFWLAHTFISHPINQYGKGEIGNDV